MANLSKFFLFLLDFLPKNPFVVSMQNNLLKEIAGMTNEQLKEILLTVDGRGKTVKELVLEELMDRQYSSGQLNIVGEGN